jgi:hypothetical protein
MTWVVDDLTHLEGLVTADMDLGKAPGILALAVLMVNFLDPVKVVITETKQGILVVLAALVSRVDQTVQALLGTLVQAVQALLGTLVQDVLVESRRFLLLILLGTLTSDGIDNKRIQSRPSEKVKYIYYSQNLLTVG